MKKTSDTILKKEIIISFSELLLKEVALNYLDLLKKYEKGDAHHLILEFLNVSVAFGVAGYSIIKNLKFKIK